MIYMVESEIMGQGMGKYQCLDLGSYPAYYPSPVVIYKRQSHNARRRKGRLRKPDIQYGRARCLVDARVRNGANYAGLISEKGVSFLNAIDSLINGIEEAPDWQDIERQICLLKYALESLSIKRNSTAGSARIVTNLYWLNGSSETIWVKGDGKEKGYSTER